MCSVGNSGNCVRVNWLVLMESEKFSAEICSWSGLRQTSVKCGQLFSVEQVCVGV